MPSTFASVPDFSITSDEAAAMPVDAFYARAGVVLESHAKTVVGRMDRAAARARANEAADLADLLDAIAAADAECASDLAVSDVWA